MKTTILIMLCSIMVLCAEEKPFENSMQLTASAGVSTPGAYAGSMIKVKRESTLYGISVLAAAKLFGSQGIVALQLHYGRAISSKWTYANAYLGIGYSEGTTQGAFDPDDESWFGDGYEQIPFRSPIISANAEAGVKIYYVGIGLKAGFEAATLPTAYIGLQVIIDIPF